MSIHGKGGGGKGRWHCNPNRPPPPPLLLLPTHRPPYSSLKADCEDLNCFHMSGWRTEFVAFGNPCCIQLRQLLPVCSQGRPPVHACARVCVCACLCVCVRARVRSCTRTCAPDMGTVPRRLCGRNPSALVGADTNPEQFVSPPFLRSEPATDRVKQYTSGKNANKLRSGQPSNAASRPLARY